MTIGPSDRRTAGSVTRADVPFVVLALAAGALLLYLGRSLTFWHDEWRSITFDGGIVDYFRPVNEHWSTFPLALYRATFEIVELRSYLPYLAQVIVLHLVAVSGAYVLMRRRLGPFRRHAAGAAVAVARSGSGESLLGISDRIRRVSGVRSLGAGVIERQGRYASFRRLGTAGRLADGFRNRALLRRRSRGSDAFDSSVRRAPRRRRRPRSRISCGTCFWAAMPSVRRRARRALSRSLGSAARHRLLGRVDGRPRQAPDARRRSGSPSSHFCVPSPSTSVARAGAGARDRLSSRSRVDVCGDRDRAGGPRLRLHDARPLRLRRRVPSRSCV